MLVGASTQANHGNKLPISCQFFETIEKPAQAACIFPSRLTCMSAWQRNDRPGDSVCRERVSAYSPILEMGVSKDTFSPETAATLSSSCDNLVSQPTPPSSAETETHRHDYGHSFDGHSTTRVFGVVVKRVSTWYDIAI